MMHKSNKFYASFFAVIVRHKDGGSVLWRTSGRQGPPKYAAGPTRCLAEAKYFAARLCASTLRGELDVLLRKCSGRT